MQARDDMFQKKPNLLLILDDGIDWGQRGLQTFYWLGKLWETLGIRLKMKLFWCLLVYLFFIADLDTLFVVRNAPGDSRWNIIER